MHIKIIMIALGLVLISACTETSDEIGEVPLVDHELAENDLEEKHLVENDLEGSEWVLTSLNGEPLIEGTNITLAFHPSEISGFAGCNGYGAPVEFRGNNEIQIEEIMSQAEGCIEPEGVLEQESEYINILWNIAQYHVNGEVLTLTNPDNGQTLVYSNRTPFKSDPALLENTHWILLSSDSFSLINGSTITISFSKGKIEGYAGCREYQGEFEAEGDKIVFPVLEMLGELCDDQDLQIQEGNFTTWLELSTHYQIYDGHLELNLATGDTLKFERQDG